MVEEIREGEAIKHYYRGKVYDITGQIDLAIEEHITAIRLGANYADVHNSLGKLYMKKQMYEEAIHEFNKALELNPTYSEAQSNLHEAIEEQRKSKTKSPVKIEIQQVREEAIPTGVKLSLKLDFTTLIKKYKQYLFFIIPFMVVMFFLVIRGHILEKPEIISFELPSIDISSFCIKKNEIWFSDWKEQVIYKCVLKKDLKIRGEVRLTIYPTFITFVNNKALIIFDGLNRKLNFHALDKYLTLGRQLEMPLIYPSSVLFYNDYIFIADISSNFIYKLSPKDLKIIDSYNPLKKRIKIITHDGNNFIILDEENNIYLLDKNEPKSILKKYSLVLPAGKKVKYIGFTSKHIFVIFESEKLFHKLQRRYYLTPN